MEPVAVSAVASVVVLSAPLLLPKTIPERLREALVNDASSYTFDPPSGHAGPAFAMASLTDSASAPGRFVEWLTSLPEYSDLGPFVANEASFQLYSRHGKGLGPHRDQRYYVNAIVIATLKGEALFAVHGSADRGDVVAEWSTAAGQVVVLPGWDPLGLVDARPYHRVDAPTTSERLVLQLRQNLLGEPGGPVQGLTAKELEQARHLAGKPAAPRTLQ